ncbi:hypothetical protein WDV06_12890 [Streptomyces racemochromogenes]|uniref:DUF779 domain-containing protein n=1 Tax=Streptomyces racemochromogenes TaxID=67353 RepID=A0ABW7PC81_9ACTN
MAEPAVWEPLSEDVRRTLELLLDGDGGDLQVYRAQIPYARMTAGCTCGCPSVDLRVTQDVPAAPVAPGGSPVVASRDIATPQGAYVGEAMLFVWGGLIASLEVCHWEDLGPLVPPLWRRLGPDRP